LIEEKEKGEEGRKEEKGIHLKQEPTHLRVVGINYTRRIIMNNSMASLFHDLKQISAKRRKAMQSNAT
jgi:hypothetical protein